MITKQSKLCNAGPETVLLNEMFYKHYNLIYIIIWLKAVS